MTRAPLVVIAGGGTGGHIFPGLAVAAALRTLVPELGVTWVGGRRGQESRIVAQHDVPLRFIAADRIVGGSLLARVQGVVALFVGLVQALVLLGRAKPVAVLGVGGYASAAVGLAAWLLRRPLVIAEQNALPGRTNRALGRLAGRVAVAFEQARAFFPAGRTVLTGNPVRAGIRAATPPAADPLAPRRLLVLGGSQGARFLNERVPALLARLAAGQALEVRHQCGAAELPATQARYAALGLAADVVAFIDDMAGAYATADFVICRAGATTVAELTAAGRPALLVPFPFAADDHQAHNARALVEAGAAEMVRQEAWDEAALAARLHELLAPERVRAMGACAERLARPEAARAVAELVLAAGHVTVAEGAR